MVTFDNLSVLVIEANPSMRTQLRSMLESFQVTGVQFAPSAGSAIRKLREKFFDVVFCNHDLGEGQDGQHLLEDLRQRNIIPRRTLFIMITSERNYARVIGTAELQPNDYILKPLTASILHERLERALKQRELFLPLYRALDQGDLETALNYCVTAEEQHPRHRVEFMRERAELLVAQGQLAEAQAVYEAILAIKPIPWARLGLARILFANQRFEEAEEILSSLVAEHTYFLAAYDWLARTRQELGTLEKARNVLATAVELSPHKIERLRSYAQVTMASGDAASAAKTLAEVVRKGKYSDFRNPADHLALARAQIAASQLEEAEATIRDLQKSMPGMAEATICTALAKSMLLRARNDDEGARQAVQEALQVNKEMHGQLSTEVRQELIDACLDNQLDKEGSELAAHMLRTAQDAQTLEHSRSMLRKRGRDDLADEIEQRIHEEVKRYVALGAQKAQEGDFDGAVQEMMDAVRRLPGNPHVLTNATLALLRHLEYKGWNERLAAQARSLIMRTRRLDPDNAKLAPLTHFLQNLGRKYGIRADRATQLQENEQAPQRLDQWLKN